MFKILKKIFLPIFLLTVFLNTLLWQAVIPYNEAPDEYTHFQVAEFIAENHRFPVFGQSPNMGVSQFSKPGFREYYNASYSSMPPLAYMIQALGIKLIPGSVNTSYLSARLTSAFLAVFFALVVFKFSQLFFNSFLKQLSFSLLTVFIPQVTFIFSYINSDALSLLLSSVLLYCFFYVRQKKVHKSWQATIIAGLLIGLTALSRYNAFVIFPFMGIFYFWLFIKSKDKKNVLLRIIVLLFTAFLVAGWWYLRNLILYQDVLATKKFWQTVHMLYPPQNIGQDFYTLSYILFRTNWLWLNFKSFWASFGWNYIFLPEAVYRFLLLFCLWAAVGLVRKWSSFNSVKKSNIVLSFLMLLGCGLLSLWQSWHFAFQAQGRYFFPILSLLIFVIISGLLHLVDDKKYQILVLVLIPGTIIILNTFCLISLLIPAYY